MFTSLWSIRYVVGNYFIQKLLGSRDNRGMVGWSLIDWVKSCALLIYGDYDIRLPLGANVPNISKQ